MLKAFFEKKYGPYITSKILDPNNSVWNRSDESENGQVEVIRHLKGLKNSNGKNLIPTHFFVENIHWGLDFSGWIGELNEPKTKDFFFIGAEPHLKSNFQLVYDFGNQSGGLSNTSSYHYSKIDIWRNLVDIFVDDPTDINVTNFLNKCYITDLCHIVPKGCGQVNEICRILSIKTKEWNTFRAEIAEEFLFEEISIVRPQYIFLHGNPSRKFFKTSLFEKPSYIADSKFKILEGQITIKGVDYKIVSIPHLKGQLMNELWRCKKYPERPKCAKRIIRSLIG